MPVLNYRFSIWTVLVVLGAAGISTVASAADLAGNCCGDLEERIAELEATTVRKGNRKVSVTVSGFVNEAIFFWDDGVERNAYTGTNSLEQGRVKVSGKAKVDGDWSAGYTLEFGLSGNPSNAFAQDVDSTSPSPSVRKSVWFVEHKTLGKLTVGQDGTSTYHVLDDSNFVNSRGYSDAEAAAIAMGAFRLRTGGVLQNVQWSQILGGFNNNTAGQGGRRNIVKYDSPAIAGFSVSASWGEDDMWDAALSYRGEAGDFKIGAKAGYGETTDNNDTGSCAVVGTRRDCQWWGVSATIQHIPTGLFLYGGYGQQMDDNAKRVLGASAEDTNSTAYIQGGIEQKVFAIGKTVVFGEYRKDEAGSPEVARTLIGHANSIRESEFDFWATGIVQSIDAAAMDVYVIYRHAEGVTTDFTSQAKTPIDGFDMIMMGARIQF